MGESNFLKLLPIVCWNSIKLKPFNAKNQAKCTILGRKFWKIFFPSTLLPWLWDFSINFFLSFLCTLSGYVFLPCGMFCRSCIKIIHLRNEGGGTSEADEEEVLLTMVSMLAKKKRLLVLDVNGLLVATYHKQEALLLEFHHMKFNNSYNNNLLFLFFSIAFFFSFFVEEFVHLVYL